MDIELIKQDYLDNKRLSDNELLFLFENFLDTVLKQSKFDNTLKTFYTHKNFLLLKIIVSESNLQIPVELDSKFKNVVILELKLLEKESKIGLYLGLFMIIFGVIIYFLFQNEFNKAPVFFIISLILFGSGIMFKGIIGLRRLKK